MKNSMKTTVPPSLKFCEIMSESTDGEGNTIYTVRERTVDAAGSAADEIQEAYPVGGNSFSAGDVGAITSDKEGKRFILSGAGNNLLAVKDQGDGTGKLVERSGTSFIEVTGAAALPVVFTEPLSKFHSGVRHTGADKIYPAINKGTFYLCFVRGHGDSVGEASDYFDGFNDNDTLTFEITTDFRNNMIGLQTPIIS